MKHKRGRARFLSMTSQPNHLVLFFVSLFSLLTTPYIPARYRFGAHRRRVQSILGARSTNKPLSNLSTMRKLKFHVWTGFEALDGQTDLRTRCRNSYNWDKGFCTELAPLRHTTGAKPVRRSEELAAESYPLYNLWQDLYGEINAGAALVALWRFWACHFVQPSHMIFTTMWFGRVEERALSTE